MAEPTGNFITVKNYNYDLNVYRNERTNYDKYGFEIPKKGPHYDKGTTHKAARVGGRLYVAENRPSHGPAYEDDYSWDPETGRPRPTSAPRMTWKERTARGGGILYWRAPVESSALLDTFVLLAVMAEMDSTYRPAGYRYRPYREPAYYSPDTGAVVVGGRQRIMISEAVIGGPAVTYRPQALDLALGFPVTPQVTALKNAGLLVYRPDIRDKRERVQSIELTVEDGLRQAVRETYVGGQAKGVWYPQDPITDPDGEALAEAFSEALGS